MTLTVKIGVGAGFLILLLSGVLTPRLVRGATSEGTSYVPTQIIESRGGRNPVYEMVGEPNSDGRAPGVYRLSDSALIVPGQVVGLSRVFRGAVAQLEMGDISGRHETLAVVNGHLVLFSSMTSVKRPESFIEFGLGRAVVRDPMTQLPISIDKIENVQNVSVLSLRLPSLNSELILVSLKQVNSFGNGITFGGLIAQPHKSNTSRIDLASPLSIISYDFFERQHLETILLTAQIKSQPVLYSPLLLNAHAQPRPNEPEAIAKWRREVRGFLAELKAGKFKKDLARPMIPAFNLQNGSVEIQKLPAESINSPVSAFNIEIVQQWDPLRGADAVVISSPRADQRNLTLLGRIDENSKKRSLVSRSLAEASFLTTKAQNQGSDQFVNVAGFTVSAFSIETMSLSSIVFSVNGSLYLVAEGQKEPAVLGLGAIDQVLPIENVDQMEHVLWALPERNKSVEYILLVSASGKGGKKGLLQAFTFQYSESGHFHSIGSVKIASRFFTRDSLLERSIPFRDGFMFNLFDDDSEVRRANESGQFSFSPYVRLDSRGRKKSNEMRYVHLRASQTLPTLFGPELNWLSFQSTGSVRGEIGLFLSPEAFTSAEDSGAQEENRLRPVAPGAYVAPPELSGESEAQVKTRAAKSLPKNSPESLTPFLASRLSAELPESEVSVVTEEKPKVTGELQVYLTETNKTHVAVILKQPIGSVKSPVFFAHSFPCPKDSIENVGVVFGRRHHKNEGSLLIFFRPTDSVSAGQGACKGVKAIRFEFNLKTSGQSRWFDLVPSNPVVVTEEDTEASQLAFRLVYDESGKPYWISRPHEPRHSPDFLVVPLYEGASRGSRVNDLPFSLVWDENTASDEGWAGAFLRSWRIWTSADFRETWPYVNDLLLLDKAKLKKSIGWDISNPTAADEMFPQIGQWIQGLTASGSTEHQVVLVDRQTKGNLQFLLANRYLTGTDDFSIRNSDFGLFVWPSSREFTDSELRRALKRIGGEKRNKALLVDARDLLSKESRDSDDSSASLDDADADETSEGESASSTLIAQTSANEPASRMTSRLKILAAEGKDLEVPGDGLERLTKEIPTVILATPEEWRQLRQESVNTPKIMGRFTLKTSYLSASWMWWPPRSPRANDEVARAAKRGLSPDAARVFPDLNRILEGVGRGMQTKKHRLIVYPDELSTLMETLTMGKWAAGLSEGGRQHWHYSNSHLALIKIPSGEGATQVRQAKVFEMYSALPAIRESRNPVVVAFLRDINSIGRPSNGGDQGVFRLVDRAVVRNRSDVVLMDSPHSTESEGAEAASLAQANELAARQIPHLFWIVATEGAKSQPRMGENWQFRQQYPVQTDTVIFGSQSEFQRLKGDLGFEGRMADLIGNFEVVYLSEPPVEVRRNLVSDLLTQRRRIGLGLRFLDNNGAESTQEALVAVLIARIEQIARQNEWDPTTAFIRVYSSLNDFLARDSVVRMEKVFDRKAIERLVHQIFPVGIRPESLPPGDQINLIRDPNKASQRWREKGYRGYSDLKRRFMNLHLTQTDVVPDQGRNIPFSYILVGKTSVGKSFLVESYFKMLGLRELDWQHSPYDSEADYFIVKVQDLYDGNFPGGGKLSVDECLQILDNLIFHNPRAHIVFDDLHKAASNEVLRKLLAYASGLLETKVTYRATSRDGKTKDVPVRGLGFGILINRQNDLEIRKRFNADKNPMNEVIAMLHRPGSEGVQIEESFPTRFAAIIDMNRFPVGAKVESLVSDSRRNAAAEFVARERLVLVSPSAVTQLAGHFADAHGRDFANALPAIFEIPQNVQGGALVLVDLKNTLKNLVLHRRGQQTSEPKPVAPIAGNEVSREGFRKAVNELFSYRLIDGRAVGPLMDFLSFVLDGFRIRAFEILLEAVQEDDRIAGDFSWRKLHLAPLLLGLFHHLSEWVSVPLDHVPLHPEDLGFDPMEKADEFEVALEERSEAEDLARPFFPNRFGITSPFLDRSILRTRSIRDVMAETAWEIREVLKDILEEFIRVDDLAALPATDDWIDVLTIRSSRPEAEEARQRELLANAEERLSKIFLKFSEDIFDEDLAEFQVSEGVPQENPVFAEIKGYDRARLFLQVFDKAIASLPWGKVTRFLFNNIMEVNQNIEHGHMPAYQDLLFRNSWSPFVITTTDGIMETIAANPIFSGMTEVEKRARRDRYEGNCRQMLAPIQNED